MNEAERSPLHYAAMIDDPKAIRRILAEGLMVDAQDQQGFAPLHLAAQQFAVSAAEALLEAGADVDVTNKFGNVNDG